MRPVVLTVAALLAAAPAARAQAPAGAPAQPGAPAAAPGGPGGVPAAVPGAPPGPQASPPPPAAPAADPKLDAHLGEWEKKMQGLVNFRTEFTLTRKEPVFNKERTYNGQVLCMKPNFAILRLDNVANKDDYEAYVCNGQAIYEYNGLQKTITEWKLNPNPGAGGGDNLMLDFLSGMKAAAAKERFQITLFKEDAHYVYLDIRPRLPKDQQEFVQARFALFGPNTPFPYLPAQMYLAKPGDDTEVWKFTNPQTNIPGVNAGHFQFKPVPGFEVKKAPPQAGNAGQPAPPGGNPPPGPGQVRPGKE
jgi:TIGR03009 family protein